MSSEEAKHAVRPSHEELRQKGTRDDFSQWMRDDLETMCFGAEELRQKGTRDDFSQWMRDDLETMCFGAEDLELMATPTEKAMARGILERVRSSFVSALSCLRSFEEELGGERVKVEQLEARVRGLEGGKDAT